ncbi:MAG: tetratricopeptide repeat protein [Cyanobacteriota bacterium]|nr:tetratricopeptide repeat protein [Cyanobacteriota bacterium]
MDEQRIQDYLNLIVLLLNCASGEKLKILHQHSTLIDEGLVLAAEFVAQQMEEAGKANAEWLRNFSQQLGKAIAEWKRHNQTAIQLYQAGRFAECITIAKQVLALAVELWGSEHPKVATSLNNLAALYESQGRWGEAEPLYQEALEMRKCLLGNQHPDVASSLNSAGRYILRTQTETQRPANPPLILADPDFDLGSPPSSKGFCKNCSSAKRRLRQKPNLTARKRIVPSPIHSFGALGFVREKYRVSYRYGNRRRREGAGLNGR